MYTGIAHIESEPLQSIHHIWLRETIEQNHLLSHIQSTLECTTVAHPQCCSTASTCSLICHPAHNRSYMHLFCMQRRMSSVDSLLLDYGYGSTNPIRSSSEFETQKSPRINEYTTFCNLQNASDRLCALCALCNSCLCTCVPHASLYRRHVSTISMNRWCH